MVTPRRDIGSTTPAQTNPKAQTRLAAQSNLIEGLISQLESGSAIAEAKLVGLSLDRTTTTGDKLRSQIFDCLARSAGNGSPYSMELLLRFVVEQQLAQPAITKVVSSPNMIEDIQQEVLVSISDSIHRFRGDSRFTTWLYTLARNVSVSYLRRQRPTSELPEGEAEQADGVRRMSSLVVERDALRDAIAELPAKYRDTVVLRDIQGLSYAEIAERQGLEISTIRTRLSRGRSMLAIKLP